MDFNHFEPSLDQSVDPETPHNFEPHSDDLAVDRFAVAMKAKLAKKRAEGRSGWDDPRQCSCEFLAELLLDHIPKGDPVDIANLAMMLHQREGGHEALRKVLDERTQETLVGLVLHG